MSRPHEATSKVPEARFNVFLPGFPAGLRTFCTFCTFCKNGKNPLLHFLQKTVKNPLSRRSAETRRGLIASLLVSSWALGRGLIASLCLFLPELSRKVTFTLSDSSESPRLSAVGRSQHVVRVQQRCRTVV